jgi:hypothetical protein
MPGRLRAATGKPPSHVERGGAYDARSAAINVWSCLWDTPEHRQASELIGTVYIAWNTPHADLTTIIQLNVKGRDDEAAPDNA